MRRIRVDEEALRWICTGLRSIAASGRQSESRRKYLRMLAARLAEPSRGNPNLILYGRRTKPDKEPGPTQEPATIED